MHTHTHMHTNTHKHTHLTAGAQPQVEPDAGGLRRVRDEALHDRARGRSQAVGQVCERVCLCVLRGVAGLCVNTCQGIDNEDLHDRARRRSQAVGQLREQSLTHTPWQTNSDDSGQGGAAALASHELTGMLAPGRPIMPKSNKTRLAAPCKQRRQRRGRRGGARRRRSDRHARARPARGARL